MDDGRRGTNNRKAVGLLVKLKHESAGIFEEEFATNLSPGGMFVRSKTPQVVGTLVKFEIQIANGQRMLKGIAEVRWVREAPTAEGPAGMGLQFQELDPASRALVDKMLAGRQRQEAKPVAAAVAPSIAPAAKPSPRPAVAPSVAPAPRAAATAVAVAPARAPAPAPAPAARPSPAARPAPAPVPTRPAPAPVAAARPAPAPAARAAPAPAAALDEDLFGDMDLGGELSSDGLPPELAGDFGPPPVVADAEGAVDLDLDVEADAGGDGSEVDIPLEELIAGTPAPEEAPADEPVIPGIDLDFSLADTSPAEDEPLQLEAPLPKVQATRPAAPAARPAPAPAPAPAPRAAAPAPAARPAAPAPVAKAPAPAPVAKAPAPAPAPPPAPAPAPKPKRSGLTGASREIEFDADGNVIDPDAAPAAAAAEAPADEDALDIDVDSDTDEAPPAPAPAPRGRPPAPAPAPAARSAPGHALPEIRRTVAPPQAEQKPQVLAPPTAAAPAPRGDRKAKTVFLIPPTAPVEGKGPIIGIDLGTTNSCVAILANGGKPTVLRSKDGYNTVPSVVSLTTNNKLLIGHRAKNQLVLNPGQTIYGAKRLVGRPYESAIVKQVRERFHYEVTPDEEGRAAVKLKDDVLTLEEVQGLILRECKEMAEQYLNQKVERAVITVPAYYSEPQREAVRKSGAMCGMKVERILNEPTAAALAYGLNRNLTKKVLVYDLGGGTFDATVLKIDKNMFEVLATAGDTFLGGVDFDNLIVDYLLERFANTEKIPFTGDNVTLSRVTDAAERTKIALSERSSFEVHIPMLMMDPSGKPRDMRCTVTRDELDKLCEPLVSRTLEVVRDVLLDAKLKASEVDDVILVGGQSRMPMVRERLKAFFGKPAQASVNADEAVALGAALYSGTIDKVSSVVLVDVLPMTIGVGMPGGVFKRVLERNTPLPAQRSFGMSTSKDNETTMEISLFQGEDGHISANEYLGTVRIEGLPRAPRGTVRVGVTIKLDPECVLHVEASEMSTRRQVKATIATRYSSEELQAQLGVSEEKAKEAENRRGADLTERSGKFWGFVKKAFGRK